MSKQISLLLDMTNSLKFIQVLFLFLFFVFEDDPVLGPGVFRRLLYHYKITKLDLSRCYHGQAWFKLMTRKLKKPKQNMQR